MPYAVPEPYSTTHHPLLEGHIPDPRCKDVIAQGEGFVFAVVQSLGASSSMDEVENPDLPAAGESSPTLRPIEDDEDSAIVISSPTKPPIDTAEADQILESVAARTPSSPSRLQRPPRPTLQREGSVPPLQPPPAPPPEPNEYTQDSPDSLTLAELKKLRGEFPKAQIPQKQQLLDCDTVYDFQYQDAQSLPVELEEWFTYSEEEQMKLRRCKAAFNEEWRKSEEGKTDWLDVTEDVRRAFVTGKIEAVSTYHGEEEGSKALMILTYIGLGIWEETAGREDGSSLENLFTNGDSSGSRLNEYGSSSLQIRWVVAMVDTLRGCDGIKAIFECLRKTCDDDFKSNPMDHASRNEHQQRRPEEGIELWCCLTLMYLFVEVARATGDNNARALKEDLVALEPNLLNYLTQTVARLRWDDTAPIPLTKMLLLAWKAILVTIGGITDIDNIKKSLHEDYTEMDSRGQPIITASPLDYHLFRQEIGSKYPAYQPPPPLFPLEPENNSILPPLKHRRSSHAFNDTAYTGAPSVGTDSILHQPVHIATPAPSPPPSPGGPGKAGKKQNYQTPQMFPFLYPPLDSTSNELGGKGQTQLQDALVGRRWEGAEIPTSILEAAELFAKRMRATRAMKQLWEVRVDFMKYERGWKSPDGANDESEDFEIVEKADPAETAEQGRPLPQTDEERRLNAVSKFYRDSLPHLQSVVIVILKAVLQNVTDLVTRGNGQNGLQPGIQFPETNGINGSAKPVENGAGHDLDGIENTSEELDRLRTQEIASKALSAILILLLKWFKVSHILQYEYMMQLLLDSNYVPLILKLWQTQDMGRACHVRLEREELNFFHFCQENSRQGLPALQNQEKIARASSEDEALPPPIKLKRDSSLENPLSPAFSPPDFSHPPEVDELGYPTTALPSSSIKSYSWRNMFSAINYLRVLQKVTRRKTHRALLLVSYKSSNHLKKSLKVPVRLLRYYTLKLFKSQVPFCGRKWRQGNMKIITAVWLSVPAELRDDWLSGGGGGMGGAFIGDVDGTVEDALPLEQSLRALTHWWNVRNFPDVMGIDQNLLDEEMDYFSRELEKMDLGKEVMDEGLEDDINGDGVPFQGPIEGY